MVTNFVRCPYCLSFVCLRENNYTTNWMVYIPKGIKGFGQIVPNTCRSSHPLEYWNRMLPFGLNILLQQSPSCFAGFGCTCMEDKFVSYKACWILEGVRHWLDIRNIIIFWHSWYLLNACLIVTFPPHESFLKWRQYSHHKWDNYSHFFRKDSLGQTCTTSNTVDIFLLIMVCSNYYSPGLTILETPSFVPLI